MIFPPLDPHFRPLAAALAAAGEEPQIAIAIERNDGCETRCWNVSDLRLIERMTKAMLWSFGGYRITVCGSEAAYQRLCALYAPGGALDFDRQFMQRQYDRPFEIAYRQRACDAPPTQRSSQPIAGGLNGCRIGLDVGGSDRKVSAIMDGKILFSEETPWQPKMSADPEYQLRGILDSLKRAAAHLPRIDGIGISTAGTVVDNRIRTSSLFVGVPEALRDARVENIYINACRELGADIPLTVANDGDVAALAGAIRLNANRVLGISMGTSEAGGYIDENGNVTGWLNELAFVPIDFCPESAMDPWSGDRGCGASYLSQDAAIRLAGMESDSSLAPAEKLVVLQQRMAEGDSHARRVYESLGVYLGYAVAEYAWLYDMRHVLVMGRVTSGPGGEILIGAARTVLQAEFPHLAERVELHLPDEASRRIGQSIAAARLINLN